MGTDSEIVDLKPKVSDFRAEILQSLLSTPKTIHPKFLYDERGSFLFNRITELDEYYLTRTEKEIIEQYGNMIADYVGRNSTLVELGGGDGTKGSILLRYLKSPMAYFLIDISMEALRVAVKHISTNNPSLKVVGVWADYMDSETLAKLDITGRKSLIFLGSTIGNMEREVAMRFLSGCKNIMLPDDTITLGIDLKKDRRIIERAYNDSQGITAMFNLNLITRIRNEFAADIDVSAFRHKAFYNEEKGRIEMHLESLKDQAFIMDGIRISLREGETIHTENSYKYSVDEFRNLLEDAGFKDTVHWTDSGKNFALFSARS